MTLTAEGLWISVGLGLVALAFVAIVELSERFPKFGKVMGLLAMFLIIGFVLTTCGQFLAETRL